ncbi:MAG TPA: carboxypeptidase-like regulatory domain-containing protein [Chitinophagaceae bacterium]|nr:carboxypeptidase-like regulatory domain-containing protein [Chitinophagaceae bacterium]
MPRLLLIFLGCFFVLQTHAQSFIKGRVVNETTNAPIAGCSIFISGTSIGTISNSEGHFELTNVASGKQELIISSVGYETVVYPFTEAELPLNLKVQMSIKVQQLGNVTVEPFLEEGWDKWGQMFTDNFIGTSTNAGYCRIKNKDKIRFRYYKKSNRVIAICDEPLQIENKALGYTIRYQLEDFEVNFKEHTTFYLGYTLFEDNTKEGKEPKEKWQRKREEAYNGSVMHFMRSLYNNKLSEEGFEVRRMTKIPNLEKQRIREMYKMRRVGNTVTVGFGGGAKGDSAEYYNRIMRQDDMINIYGTTLLTADSLTINTKGEEKFLAFDNYLYVTYKNEQEDEKYLQFYRESRKPTFQRSYVTIIGDEGIIIDKAGNYFNPQHFFTSAYWGWGEKIANMVPSDYVPGK